MLFANAFARLFALASEAAREEAERTIADETCAQHRRPRSRTTASAVSSGKGGAPAGRPRGADVLSISRGAVARSAATGTAVAG